MTSQPDYVDAITFEDVLARAVMGALQCDVMPACREDCGMDCDGDHEERECYEHPDPENVPFTGDVCWLAQSVVDAIRPLLAGGVPGRSDAQVAIEAERAWWVEKLAALCDDEWLRLRDRAMRLHGTKAHRWHEQGASVAERLAHDVRRLLNERADYEEQYAGNRHESYLRWMTGGRDEPQPDPLADTAVTEGTPS